MSRSSFRVAPVAAMLAVAMVGVAIAAPQKAAPQKPAGQGGRHHQMMAKLDANQDGVIDRAEAAAHPRLAAGFDRLDKNDDGRLDASERPGREGKRGRHRGPHGMGHAITLDTDGDGRISTIEAKDSRLAAGFATTDLNRDGYLVRSELRTAATQRHGERASARQQHFAEKFAAADSNRDGKLSRAEVEAKMPKHAKAFAFLDEDRDGFLTPADLRPQPRR